MAMAGRSAGGLLKRYGYTELKQIGEGSFGKAMLVESDQTNAKMVCKMIDVSQATQKETQDTVKEAQLLAAFKHPFIVEYCASFLENGWLCILMAYCEGGDLTNQVDLARQARRHIKEEQVLRWMTQALLALKYIHDKHILHRDLKSGNFFLSKNGNLKMGDFGIAKVLTCTQAVAKTQIGTPYYLSPEVCQEKPYAWPSDIWAMGVILYELCALKLPFDGGQNMVVLLRSICSGTPSPLPEAYSGFTQRLCSEMLNKNPAHRPSADSILKRPEMARVVKKFFDEAEAKAAKDRAEKDLAAAPPDFDNLPSTPSEYKQGDLVEYFSNTHQKWVPTSVTSVDAQGQVIVDVKPNTWMSLEQQAQQLRRRQDASSRKHGVCSTQVLEEMLDLAEFEDKDAVLEEAAAVVQETAESAPPPPPPPPLPPADESALPTAPADLDRQPSLARVSSFDDECSKLLEELGFDEDSPVKAPVAAAAAPTLAPPPQSCGIAAAERMASLDGEQGSLTAAELDLLNASV
eukprot:TRINITY_DN3224_c0_g2_i1.p1 TRINITY_DN3224_c0_g2~~TRINITY_DN3224_c0_g2_i1.p1  ORF type:complete len:518 (-),score=162.45 TRINITY_DN3224_c0_g2_i1:127-1680(-)